jgi:hypothetical protein
MNPMHWDCDRQGCFNVHRRPKIEVFAECLPGRIAFSDVDGIVEINGNLLVLEWKNGRYVPRGQALLYSRWTANSPTVAILVVGDAQHMTVDEVAYVAGGKIGEWQTTDLAGLKALIADWSTWALSHPATANRRQTA